MRKFISDRDMISLTVLALLAEEPRHPYEIQRLIRVRHKDFAMGNTRGLYHAVEKLIKAGLIIAEETNREGKRPERTIYRITDEGREEFNDWLAQLISTPQAEYPVFLAAVSYLGYVPEEQALKCLQTRAVLLQGEIAGMDATLQGLGQQMPRLLLLEMEYTRVLRQAEMDWIKGLIREIQDRKITWSTDWIQKLSAQPFPGKNKDSNNGGTVT